MKDDPRFRPYAARRIALLTQHGKEGALAPILLGRLGARLEVVRGFDTDTLGTFTRDVPREGTQLEAARRKASIALELSGASVGLGSEGAFVPGPFGLGSWNVELVTLVDADRGIEVTGVAHGPGLHAQGIVRSAAELEELAVRARFPGHALVVRPDGPDGSGLRKGIDSPAALAAAFEEARLLSPSGGVFVESDLRAHLHPSRMELIAKAGEDLAARLCTPCPGCGCPGFGFREQVPGLPCSACGTETDEARADLHACVRCDRVEERPRPGPATASPGHCPFCNP